MDLLKVIIFFWTFCGLVADLEAIKCPKGQGRIKDNNKYECKECSKGYFQSEDNSAERCKPCRKCNEGTGSMIVHNCTLVTNTKCQCPKGSESLERDSVTCRCHIGNGLQNGECVKCKDGYFSEKPNSSCQKWRECPSGVKENGTNTKNVICKDHEITTDPTSNRSSFTTHLVSTPQRTTTTTAPPVTSKDKDLTSNSSYTDNYIGVVLIILGITGLLILTALTCKLRIDTYMRRKTKTRDSSCRKPVEESGDSSLTSLKQNPEEP